MFSTKATFIGLVLLLAPIFAWAESTPYFHESVIIGLSEYEDFGYDNLLAADDDPYLIAASLSESSAISRVLVDASKKDILESIDSMVGDRSRPNRANLIYVTGHGNMDALGDHVFIPEEDKEHPIGLKRIYLQDIVSAVSQSEHQYVIFWDTCRNNDLRRAWNDAYLLNLPANVSVLFSTSPGTLADDSYPDQQYTVFAEQVAAEIARNTIDLPDIARTVTEAIEQSTNGRQIPQFIPSPCSYLEDPRLLEFRASLVQSGAGSWRDLIQIGHRCESSRVTNSG